MVGISTWTIPSGRGRNCTANGLLKSPKLSLLAAARLSHRGACRKTPAPRLPARFIKTSYLTQGIGRPVSGVVVAICEEAARSVSLIEQRAARPLTAAAVIPRLPSARTEMNRSESPVTATSERSAQGRVSDHWRWLAVIPTALIGGWLGRICGGVLIVPRDAHGIADLVPLFTLMPSGLGFTLAGALVAPRFRLRVALVLAMYCSGLALFVHLLLPLRIGRVNYLHAAGEFLGAVGAVLICRWLVMLDRSKAKVSCVELRARKNT